jgi:cobalamin biosynthesis protein CobT
MQKLVLLLAFLGLSLGQQWWNPVYIFQTNSAKKKAAQFYQEKQYKDATSELLYMNNVWKLEEPTVTLNLAHAYFEQQDTSAVSSALNYYSQAVNSKNDKVRSIANLQVGILKAKRAGSEKTKPKDKKKIYEDALVNFKNALRADQYNEEARFDYELLKRLLEIEAQKQEEEQKDKSEDEKQKEEQEQQEQDEQKSEEDQKQDEQDGQENKEQDQSKEEKDAQKQAQQQQSPSDRLKDMDISQEKAEQILDAMRQNEAQYLQQQQRKGKKPRKTGKPDW